MRQSLLVQDTVFRPAGVNRDSSYIHVVWNELFVIFLFCSLAVAITIFYMSCELYQHSIPESMLIQ